MTKYRLRLTNLNVDAWIANKMDYQYLTFFEHSAEVYDTIREATEARGQWQRLVPEYRAEIEEVTK